MEHKKIAIEIEIENEMIGGMVGSFVIRDVLFTEYDGLFDSEQIIDKYKTAMKRLTGFTMMTATLTLRNDGDYGYNKAQDVVSSFRYTNRYDEVKYSKWFNNRYENWFLADKKDMTDKLKDMIALANRTYIQALKQNIAA